MATKHDFDASISSTVSAPNGLEMAAAGTLDLSERAPALLAECEARIVESVAYARE